MLLDDQLQKEDPQVTPMTDQEIFTQIWSQPRKVFHYINATGYEVYLTAIVVLLGISNAFDNAVSRSMGDDMPLVAIILICVLLGGVTGWISTFIYAALIKWVGTWLEGKAESTQAVFRMVGYGSLPIVASLPLLLAQILVFGNGLFQSDLGDYEGSLVQNVVLFGSGIIEIGLAIWSFILVLVGLSEVQGFSLGKAFLNLLLPALIIIIPLALILVLLLDLGA